MRASDIRNLIRRLERLNAALCDEGAPVHHTLAKDHPLAREASDCELMLPSILTVASLREAVERKLNTAHVLLRRAERHEELSPDMQLAADEGYLADEGDLQTPGRDARPGAWT